MTNKSAPSPVRIYKLPLSEIHKRYGLPGECRETAPMIPDIDGLAQRRAERKRGTEDDKKGAGAVAGPAGRDQGDTE